MSEHLIDGEAIAASLTNPPAFGVIFERHFGAIHSYLRRRLDRQLADELASQTFLRYREEGSWLVHEFVFDPATSQALGERSVRQPEARLQERRHPRRHRDQRGRLPAIQGSRLHA